MKPIYITRRETFNAAHKLYKADWSEQNNEEIFGKCANKNWHGHNFTLWVTVKGTPHADTGFVMNLKTLSKLVKDLVIEALDHKNLNLAKLQFLYKKFKRQSSIILHQKEPRLHPIPNNYLLV